MVFEVQMGPGQHWVCEQHIAPLFCLVSPNTEEPLWFLWDSVWLLNSFLTGVFLSSLLQTGRQNQDPIRLKESEEESWTPSKQTKAVWNF